MCKRERARMFQCARMHAFGQAFVRETVPACRVLDSAHVPLRRVFAEGRGCWRYPAAMVAVVYLPHPAACGIAGKWRQNIFVYKH